MASLKSEVCFVALVSVGLGCSSTSTNLGQVASPAGATTSSASERPRCLSDSDQVVRAVRTFRETYPEHFQTVALSPPFGEGCRVLVVAEPPPSVSPAALQQELAYGTTIQWSKQPIGYDGWVSDAATIVPPAAPELLDQHLASLNRRLFGTDYKRVTTAIGETPPGASRVNLEIRPAELGGWLTPQVTLTPVTGGPNTTVASALAGSSSGVFFPSSRGLVVWALPRPSSLDARAAEAREFAIDSDLVLGAVASQRGLLIVGRERNTPVERIQPVRFETLRTLASATGAELAQSYERNNVLAGRDEGKDWAPIYLSPELVDTEFGSVLDLADQELKSCSNNGATSYTNFDYPSPLTWPFKDALPRQLGASSLTYNWNTRGAGAIVAAGGREIYWVRNTGALPISYLPEGAASDDATTAEIDAQRFFAAQEDPLLVRVVQYSALYQIFKAFDVSATAPAPAVDLAAAGQILENATFAALQHLLNADDDSLRTALFRELGREGVTVTDASGAPTETAIAMLLGVGLLQERLTDDSGKSSDQGLRLVAKALANPSRDMAKTLERLRAGVKLSEKDASNMVELLLARSFEGFAPVIRSFVPDLGALKQDYVAAGGGSRAAIIRTPSIVLSKNGGVMREAMGGHDLVAGVPRVTLAETGATLVDLEGNVSRLPALRRLEDVTLGKGGTILAGGTRLGTTEEVLGRSVTPAALRGYVSPRVFAPAGAAAEAGAPTARLAGFEVQKTETGFALRTPAGETLNVSNRVELVNTLSAKLTAGEESVVITGRGLTPDEMRGLVRSSELKLQRDVLAITESGRGGFFKEPFDFRAATIDEVRVSRAVDGSAEATMRISGRTARGNGFVGRIKMFFSRLAVSKHGQRLTEIVQGALAKVRYQFGSRPASLQDIAQELRRELRRVDAGNGILIDHDVEPSDMIIGENGLGYPHVRAGASPAEEQACSPT